MITAAFVFTLLLVLGVPIAFIMLGASVVYFIENPMMASIVAQRMSSSLESFPLLAVPFSSWRGRRWRPAESQSASMTLPRAWLVIGGAGLRKSVF